MHHTMASSTTWTLSNNTFPSATKFTGVQQRVTALILLHGFTEEILVCQSSHQTQYFNIDGRCLFVFISFRLRPRWINVKKCSDVIKVMNNLFYSVKTKIVKTLKQYYKSKNTKFVT